MGDNQGFGRARAIFERAVELPADERAIYVDEACGDDAALRAEVDALIEAHADAGGFLATPTSGGPATPVDAPAAAVATVAETVGDVIGRYKLLQELGEGGFGVVYLAEQTEPVQRRVALKIIKLGMDTKQVIGRFESERQALALMDHPNIARVLDAGATDTGRPYFVMELVKGIPITEYCDRTNMPTIERLAVFTDVCHAVQHAHQKGIIHRDIKPSNVLVTDQDGRPVPKVIDFGIAKATDRRLTEKTVFTQLGQFIGTPAYMSPEQAELTGLDIDTRSDVYSLGVLLYELLTGITPFESSRLRSAGFAEVLRIIREEEPQRPSTRLSSLHDEAGDPARGTSLRVIAKFRQTDPRTLTRSLRGDLDWIVMKALDKDRVRRYETASGLAADIDRSIRDEPVVAGPPSPVYRLRKLVRRNRGVFVAAAAIVVLLVGGIVGTSLGLVRAKRAEGVAIREADRATREADRANAEAVRANREAETAHQVADFLIDLFEESDPTQALGEELTARELLDQGAERIAQLENEPVMQATFMHTIGYVYLVLGLFDQSRPLLDAALAIRERHADEDELALADSLVAIANYHTNVGTESEGLPIVERAVEIRIRHLGEDHEKVAQAINTLGNTLWHLDRMDEAEATFRRSLAIRERIHGNENHIDIAQSLHNLGAMHFFDNDYEEAARLWQRSIDIHRAVGEAESHHTATSIHTLSIVYQQLGDLERALELQLEAMAMRERVLGPDHPHMSLSLCTLGNIYRDLGRADEAESPNRRAIEVATATYGAEHPEVWWMRRSLAQTLLALDRVDEAEAELVALIDFIETQDAPRSLPQPLLALGTLLVRNERFDEAEATYLRAMRVVEETESSESPDLGMVHARLGALYHLQGRPEEAEAGYRTAIELMEAAWGAGDPDLEAARDEFATILREQGRDDEAETLRRPPDAE